jgi:hypothetical protein
MFQIHSAGRQPTFVSDFLQVEAHVVLIAYTLILVPIVIGHGQASTCLHGTGSTESLPHTFTHSHTSGTSKVVCHALAVAPTPSRAIACVSDAPNILQVMWRHISHLQAMCA